MFRTFSVNGIGLPLSSQPCSTLELAVMCRCAWECLITFEPGIFANVLVALRAAADSPIRVARLSFANPSLRTSDPSEWRGDAIFLRSNVRMLRMKFLAAQSERLPYGTFRSPLGPPPPAAGPGNRWADLVPRGLAWLLRS